MMTDEKANTEDQSNMEDQVTEQSAEGSTEEVNVSTESTEETVETAAETEAVASEDSVEGGESIAQAEESASEIAAENVEPVVEEEVVPKKEKKVDNGRRWYSLRVISGKERKIKERIELEIQRSGWTDFITQILVPTEKVYKIRQGKKVISERNILPGYILVEALAKNFTGEMVQAITGMPNVIHFLGRNNPIPMQQSEANRMLGKVDESQDVGESLLEPFIVGETVKIIDGPFNEFVGDIQEINDEKKKLKVIVKIFGRGTEVELNFMQVEKQ
jgi:transcriptional antiterminator NusG